MDSIGFIPQLKIEPASFFQRAKHAIPSLDDVSVDYGKQGGIKKKKINFQ